jgi:hypothetical protein
MEEILEKIIADKFRAQMAPREEAVRKFMMGQLAIKDWPLDDFQLAICAMCGLLAAHGMARGGVLSPETLWTMREGYWCCDGCNTAAAVREK